MFDVGRKAEIGEGSAGGGRTVGRKGLGDGRMGDGDEGRWGGWGVKLG